MDEQFVTQEDIELLKSRDARWQAVELAIKLDEELNNSPTVNLILDALERRSKEAIEWLVQADPTDVRKIASLQEQVNCARFVNASINAIRLNGLVAHRSLDDEGNVELEPHNAGSER